MYRLLIGSLILFFVCMMLNQIISDRAYKKLLPEEKSKLIGLQAKSSIRNSLCLAMSALFFAVLYFIPSIMRGFIIFLFGIAFLASLFGIDIVFIKKLKKADMPPSYMESVIFAKLLVYSSLVCIQGILSYMAFIVWENVNM